MFCGKNRLPSDMKRKEINVAGPENFNPAFLKDHVLKMISGRRRDADCRGEVEVWVVYNRHSVLLRYYRKIDSTHQTLFLRNFNVSKRRSSVVPMIQVEFMVQTDKRITLGGSLRR